MSAFVTTQKGGGKVLEEERSFERDSFMWLCGGMRIKLVSTRGSVAGGGGGLRLLQWL